MSVDRIGSYDWYGDTYGVPSDGARGANNRYNRMRPIGTSDKSEVTFKTERDRIGQPHIDSTSMADPDNSTGRSQIPQNSSEAGREVNKSGLPVLTDQPFRMNKY